MLKKKKKKKGGGGASLGPVHMYLWRSTMNNFSIYFVFRSDKNTRVIVRHNGGAIIPSFDLNRVKWMLSKESLNK